MMLPANTCKYFVLAFRNLDGTAASEKRTTLYIYLLEFTMSFLPPKQGAEPPPPKKTLTFNKELLLYAVRWRWESKGSSKSWERSTASLKLGNMICFLLAVELSDLDGKIPI